MDDFRERIIAKYLEPTPLPADIELSPQGHEVIHRAFLESGCALP
jgi:hypothetical protein